MTSRQRDLVEFLESKEEWVPVALVRQQFHQKTIDVAIELGLIACQDGFLGPRCLEDKELDIRAARLDQLMNQSVGRRMHDAAAMRGELED